MAGEIEAETSAKEPGSAAARGGKRRSTRDENPMSQALKSAYQRTIDEDIPAEMLDLLSKLD